MTETTLENLLRVARETIEAAKFCFLITQARDGQPNARLMQPFGLDVDEAVYFGASPQSRKVQEIQKDGAAVLAYDYAEDGAYVVLRGEASVETDSETRRRYWRESFSAFWPEGPEGKDYVVIRFVPRRIEVMNIERGVAPEPFGLQPAVLERDEETWTVIAH